MRRAYVHLPRFPVQRRVMETPSLAGKPLALVQNDRGHVRVAFASTAALKAGVRPGMTKTAACALVPELPCLPYDEAEEQKALLSLGEALLQCGPQFQLHPPDGLYVDAAAAHLFGGEEGLGKKLLEVCQVHGYRGKVAIAKDAFTARALARHGEKRVWCVAEGQSAQCLAPLPLSALDGEAEALLPPLRSLGLTTLGEVAALPPGAVVARLGSGGLVAHQLCRGEDDTPFAEPLAEVLEEKVDLDWPAEAMEPLLFALKMLLDRLCGRLAGRSLAAVRLDVALRLDPSGEARVPLRLARPSSQPRMLLDLLRHRIEDLTLPNPVVGVSAQVGEASRDDGQQLPLGDAPEGDAALEVVLSRLATTLGEEALFTAALSEAHRPEAAYGAQAFQPPRRDSGMMVEAQRLSAGGPARPVAAAMAGAEKRKKRKPQEPLPGMTEENAWLFGAGGAVAFPPAEPALAPAPPSEEEGEVVPLRPSEPPAKAVVAEPRLPSLPDGRAPTFRSRPSRFFPKPATLEAEVGQAGELKSARVLGKRRKVEAVAGPERLCGDWWEAEYARDYYRVYLEGLGPVWIFRDERDGHFYLHGMFD